MGSRVVGVDFGHGVVRGAEVEDPGTRRQRVLRTASVPVDVEAVVSGEVRDPAAAASALRQLWSKGGFRSRRVVTGMGNSRVLARDLQVPARPLAQVRESLRFLVADLLPMPLENAVLDYYPVSATTDEQGIPMYDGMLIAALKDVALLNAKAIRLANLELVGVDLIPFAIVRALADRDAPGTFAYVDVGATTTTIAIETGGVPEFVRMVPIGGDDLTRALMELGQLSRDQAEQIKRVVGLSAEGVEPRYRPVVELMLARSSELMTSVRDTLQYFVDTRRRPVTSIALTGGAAQLGRFPEVVAAWTRVPAALAGFGADPEYLVAIALAGGERTPGEPKRAAARPAPSGGPAPTGSIPVAAPPDAAPTDAVTPGAVDPPASSDPFPVAPAAAEPAAKPAKEPKAKKEKKDSIWNRPLGGGGRKR